VEASLLCADRRPCRGYVYHAVARSRFLQHAVLDLKVVRWETEKTEADALTLNPA
jgi:hypothetical protein